jgi:hypothetical protein
MARTSKADVAKAKEAKQKKIAIGGAVVLVALLAIQGPKTLKMMHGTAAAPVTSTGPVTTTPTTGALPSDPNSLAAPTLGGTAAAATTTTTSSDLVSAAPVTADPGQLQTFEKFASKDPFAAQVKPGGSSSTPPASGGSSSSGGTGTSTNPTPTPPAPPATPPAPTAPAPTTAVVKLNGEVSSVSVGNDFPTAGATFSRVGAIFHLLSMTSTTAKIAIVGGSYADGAPAITLRLNTPLTLQNTADGSKYTLVLLSPTTQVAGAPTTGAAGTTSTTPSLPVVPSSGPGG